jgi:hypothetical protein
MTLQCIVVGLEIGFQLSLDLRTHILGQTKLRQQVKTAFNTTPPVAF